MNLPTPRILACCSRRLALSILSLLAPIEGPLAAGETPASPPVFAPDSVSEWRPFDGSGAVEAALERTPDGRPAVRFPCRMAGLEQRAYWDRSLKMDLAACDRLALWVQAVGDSSAISGGTLYLRSGGGWYGAPLDVGFDGWMRAVLRRSDFRPEGSPAGLRSVDGVRVSFWKGADREAAVLLGGFDARSPSVLVVRNARAGAEATTYATSAAEALERAGIEAATVDDADVEAGILAGKRIAIYPHNPDVSAKELDALEAFAKGGGKILVCFSVGPRLARLLGIEVVGFLAREREGQFASMRAVVGDVPGLPSRVSQASWNIVRVRPKAGESRELARWYEASGSDTGHAAIVAGGAGAYISHVLLPDDPEGKGRLLRALLGHLAPAVWDDLVAGALARASRVSSWETFEGAAAGIAKEAEASGKADPVRAALARATEARDEARKLAREGKHPEALDSAHRVGDLLLEAFARAQTPRSDEFRAVWCHSAFGPKGMDWDAAVRLLAESGFDAVVPNMLWGGVADFPSKVLPVRDRVRAEGDPVARCLAACRKHGVEMHVWKVNWNLSGAPRDFVSRMRGSGRLQRDRDGAEAAWLCPSHPDNFALERDSMLEVVDLYGVDGIHFDYIRYPDDSKCYCDGCRARFEAGLGRKVGAWPRDVLRGGTDHEAYQEFRRESITRLVKAVSEEARRRRPGIRISAAVFPNWPQCREDIGQDWARWVADGLLDFVCPMDYTASNGGFRSRVRVQRDAVGGRIPFYPGVGASAPGLPVDQVIDQIRIAREEKAPGFIIFNFDGVVAERYLGTLALGTTARRDGPPQTAEPRR